MSKAFSMRLRKIPRLPDQHALPGIDPDYRERSRYYRAHWPQFHYDQQMLIPHEKLSRPDDFYEFGGRVWNMTRWRKWNRPTLFAFLRAVQEYGDIEDRPGAWAAALTARHELNKWNKVWDVVFRTCNAPDLASLF